jgi:hypothetical protein
VSTDYDSTFAKYNKYRKWQLGDKRYGPDGEYGSPRLADGEHMNGLGHEALARALTDAARLARSNENLGTWADLYCFFRELPNIMPMVRCWAVVKVYGDPTWKDAVWYGCTTKEQAEAMAPAIEEHYAKKRPYPSRDKFVVRKNYPVRVIDLLAPETTPEQVVRSLG